MLQKIKNKLVIMLSLVTLLTPVVAVGTASAVACDPNKDSTCVSDGIDTSLKCGSNGSFVGAGAQTGNQTCNAVTTGNASDLTAKVSRIINIISVIVGVIAVVMIIYGGARYVASGGKQESVTSAKNTILYAIIGLIIVALSQAIVHFVLNNAT